jgi:hypothetical protein
MLDDLWSLLSTALGTSLVFLKITLRKPLKPFEELLLGLGQQ